MSRINAEVIETYQNQDIIPNFPKGLDELLAHLDTIREKGYARVLVKPELDHHTLAINVGIPTHSAIALSGWIPEDSCPPLIKALNNAKTVIEDKTAKAETLIGINSDRGAI